MSYDPRNINQMYEQYSKTHSSKPVKFNKSPLDDDTSSSFDQFTRRETTRGLGSPTKPDDDDKQEDTGGVKGFFSRVFNLFDNSGAKKSTPIDYEGSSVYNRKEFDIKPTPVSVSELDDAPQGYDPLGINTRDFGKGVDTFNIDTDPEIPQTAMIDIGNPNKEDVNRGTSSRLAKAAAVSAGLMTPALPGMADAVNRTLSSLRMDSTDVPYVIQAGDTLSDIADKTGTTVNDLVKANDIKNKNKIYTGEELVIPTEKTTMTKEDVVSAIIKGYERDKDMSGVQVASADPDAQFYNSFNQTAGSPIENFIQRLTGSESSGNPDAEVTLDDGRKFVGLLQFGKARLKDYKNDTKTKFTQDEFKKDLSLQNDVAIWHIGDIDKVIDSVIEDSDFKNRDGLRAVAHLGGKTGMKKFVESKGQYNPEDKFGTSLMEYYKKFSN